MRNWSLVLHWTGGSNNVGATDKEHYHAIIGGDLKVVYGNNTPQDNVVTSDKIYGAHTKSFNTRCIGVSIAGMAGAVEGGRHGDHPITEGQWLKAMDVIAAFAVEYKIPVDRTRILMHSEVQPTLGIKQRDKWDINVLPWRDDIAGHVEVGNYMRELVSERIENMGPDVLHLARPEKLPNGRPTIMAGMRGMAVTEWQTDLANLRWFAGAIDGHFGDLTEGATVAFQRAHGLDPDGIVGPRTWATAATAEPKPLRKVEMADVRKNSRIVKSQDTIDGIAAIAVGGNTLDVVNQAAKVVDQVTTGAETASARVTELVEGNRWLSAVAQQVWENDALRIVGGLVILGAIVFLTVRSRQSRLEDEITGKTMSPNVG